MTKHEWLRADTKGAIIGVDREREIISGYIVAQEGPFKSDGRGEFDRDSLKAIVNLMKAAPNGLKSRFTHPDLSNDGLGKFLGRAKRPRLDKISARESYGEQKDNEISVVRADLYLNSSAHKAPAGDLAEYVMSLAETDPDAMSSSLVLTVDQEFRIDKKGRPATDDQGNELPPLWRPLQLHASDIVDTGDAVDGLLSMDGLPDEIVRKASAMLDQQFAGEEPQFIRQRLIAYVDRYLARQFPEFDLGHDPECCCGSGEVSIEIVDGPVDDCSYQPDRDPEILRGRRRNRQR